MSQSKKITELNELSTSVDSDVIAIVDVSEGETKKQTKVNFLEKGLAGGVAGLDDDGKVPQAQLPSIAITDIYVVASEVAMLALDAQIGDVAIRTDESKSYILADTDPTVLANWKELLTPPDTVQSVFGRTGTVTAQSGDYNADQITESATKVFVTPSEKTLISHSNRVVLDAITSLGDLSGTTNQVNVSGGTGAVIGAGVILSLPQDIHTGAIPQFAGVKTGKIYPTADSTTAIQILKANGTTNVVNIDTTNGYVGIKTSTPNTDFEIGDGSDNTKMSLYGKNNDENSVIIRMGNTNDGAFGYRIRMDTLNNRLYIEADNDGSKTFAKKIYIDRSTGNLTLPNNLTVGNLLQVIGIFQKTGATGETKISIHDTRSNNGDMALLSFGTAVTVTADKSMIGHIETGAYGIGDFIIAVNNIANTTQVSIADEKVRVKADGKVGIGTNSPQNLLDINSDILRLRTAKTPASAGATGLAGQICWDTNYLYICVATNTWKRIALSTW